MSNSVKSITVCIDDLSDKNFQEIQISHINLKEGVWQISVNEIGFQNISTLAISEFVQIHCNLVTDTRIFNYSTEIYLPPLASILIKVAPGEKKIVYNQKTWFLINNFDDILKISLLDPYFQKVINLKCKIFLTFLLQRIN